MYPSDYAYTYANGVDNKCYTDTYKCETSTPSNGWLYNNALQWLISPYSDGSYRVFYVGLSGFVSNGNGVTDSYGARPSTYLISNIQLDTGTGTADNPYTFKL